MINLDVLMPGVVLCACAIMLVLWLLLSRRLLGFVYVCAGWLLVVAAWRSDGKLSTLAGIAIVGALITALFVATCSMLVARRRAARSRGPVYIPKVRQ